MPGLGPFNCYLDAPTFIAQAPGMPYQQLLGGNALLSAACVAAATSLSVTDSSGFQEGQPVYILDGPNTEIVFAVTANPDPTQTSITLQAPGTQFAHAAGTSVCSDGTGGSLAQLLLAASGWVENFCQQGTPADRSLFAVSRTEQIEMPTSRAYIDVNYTLNVVAGHFPVQSVSAVAIAYAANNAFSLDPTQIMLDREAQRIAIPVMQPLGVSIVRPQLYGLLSRGDQAWAQITYIAGLTWGKLPWDFTRACVFAAMEWVSLQSNPTGAAVIREGDVQTTQRLRGSAGRETSADSIFLVQAKGMLEAYRFVFV